MKNIYKIYSFLFLHTIQITSNNRNTLNPRLDTKISLDNRLPSALICLTKDQVSGRPLLSPLM